MKLLHLEDEPRDAELVRVTLEIEGDWPDLEIEVVCNREHYVAALERGGHAAILSDYTLPQFDGVTALRLAQQKRPGVPFIFVTGHLGEEVAEEMIRAGASDFVVKDRLSKLAPAVRRALSEAGARKTPPDERL